MPAFSLPFEARGARCIMREGFWKELERDASAYLRVNRFSTAIFAKSGNPTRRYNSYSHGGGS